MARIAALLDDPTCRRRLEFAAIVDGTTGVRHFLSFADSRAQFVRDLRRWPYAVAVIDPYHHGLLQDSLISWCLRNAATRSLLLYGDFSGRPAADIVHLSRLGVRWIVTLGVDDDAQAFRRTLVGATEDITSQHFMKSVRALLPSSEYDVVEYAFYASRQPLSVPDLARTFACSERHLHRRLTQASLPAPGRLISWFRIIHATRLLEDRGRTINQVASVLGFSDPANLRRLFRTMIGVTPLELRDRGGTVVLQAAFLSLIAPLDVPSSGQQRMVS